MSNLIKFFYRFMVVWVLVMLFFLFLWGNVNFIRFVKDLVILLLILNVDLELNVLWYV